MFLFEIKVFSSVLGGIEMLHLNALKLNYERDERNEIEIIGFHSKKQNICGKQAMRPE